MAFPLDPMFCEVFSSETECSAFSDNSKVGNFHFGNKFTKNTRLKICQEKLYSNIFVD